MARVKLNSPTPFKDEDVVVDNLSVSPAKLNEMRLKGLSISSANQDIVNDSSEPDSYSVPFEFIKNIDPARLWEIHDSVSHKLKKSKRSNVVKDNSDE